MMRVMVVDDEPLARQRLQRLLAPIDGVEWVAEAENGEQALSRFSACRAEAVLLDIEMPGMNGLALARQLADLEPAPAVIFCTAYDEHAIAAFDTQAVAYLLKPVTAEKLRQALAAATRLNRAQLRALDEVAPPGAEVEFCARGPSGVQRLGFDHIRYFHADNKYVSAVHPGGELILDESLRELEVRLGSAVQRVHRNALVVWSQVVGMRRSGPGRYRVELRDVAPGPLISRRHLAAFRARLGGGG